MSKAKKPDLKKLGIKLSKTLPTYDVPLDLIDPNVQNPNRMDDESFNRLVEEIEETGLIDPIQLAPKEGGRFEIIGGEHRFRGCVCLGWKVIPANILLGEHFENQDVRDLLLVRMNMIRGDLDRESFMRLYEDKANKYGKEQLQFLFGITKTSKWKALTKGIVNAAAASGAPAPLVAELRRRTRKMGTTDDLQRVMTDVYKKHKEDLSHSFVVFALRGKSHIYIKASPKVEAALEEVVEWCRRNDRSINEVVGPLLESCADNLEDSDAEKTN
jgi:hypothetical protein